MKKHIFTAPRGEGKTTWLMQRIADTQASGKRAYYLGSKSQYFNFRSKCWDYGLSDINWLAESVPDSGFDVFTDEFMHEFTEIGTKDLDFIHQFADDWYITMSQEDFA